MNRRYISVLILFLFNLTAVCYAQSEGEKLFKENRPQEAILFLEQEIENGTASAQAYNFLGLSYYQTGDYKKSVEAFAKGLKASGTNKKVLAFNQGNSYYLMQDYENAAKSFSLAVTMDSSYSDAVLNRANSYLMNKKLDEALADYRKYIVLEPESPQKDIIMQMCTVIEEALKRREEEIKLEEIERARLAEEEKKMQEELERQRIEQEKRDEEARIAREKEEAEQRRIEQEKKAAEAERRRKLLEDVANSLQNTNSTNMSAGSEDILDYDFESELD